MMRTKKYPFASRKHDADIRLYNDLLFNKIYDLEDKKDKDEEEVIALNFLRDEREKLHSILDAFLTWDDRGVSWLTWPQYKIAEDAVAKATAYRAGKNGLGGSNGY